MLDGRASWDDVRAALVEHEEEVRRFVVGQGVQTNEVQRSWMLVPCFLELARRTGAETLDLVELGSSAGLNLVWDRYRHVYERGTWGAAAAPLELHGEERSPVPSELLEFEPRVGSRIGIDRAPIDVTSDAGARLLKSFVWPDQSWRLELLDRAVAVLRADPPELVRGDVVDVLPACLERRRPDALTVVFETAVLGYLGHDDRRRLENELARAGAHGPLAFVSTGKPADAAMTHYTMIVRMWPGGESSVVADADFHGAWIDWHE